MKRNLPGQRNWPDRSPGMWKKHVSSLPEKKAGKSSVTKRNCKYPVNPFYILPWSGYLFPGFKAHSSQTGEAVQFGPRSKPCKRQTAPAAGGTDGNRSREGDVSLNSLTESSRSFLGFCYGVCPANISCKMRPNSVKYYIIST